MANGLIPSSFLDTRTCYSLSFKCMQSDILARAVVSPALFARAVVLTVLFAIVVTALLVITLIIMH